MLDRKDVRKTMQIILSSRLHKGQGAAFKTIAGYAHGMPGQTLEVKGKLSLEQILARSWQPKGKRKKKRKGTSR